MGTELRTQTNRLFFFLRHDNDARDNAATTIIIFIINNFASSVLISELYDDVDFNKMAFF